jgi:hypothetical protein
VSDAPTYEWATHAEPDFLALQVPPVPLPDGLGDGFKALLGQRGFEPVVEGAELGPSSGCLLTPTGPASAELLITVGPRVGASRMPLTGLDPAWLERVVASGHVALLVVETAVADGTTSRAALQRDTEAGAVLGALVPAGQST